MRVCLSAEGAKNVPWPWLSPLRGWGSLTMALYIYTHTHTLVLMKQNNVCWNY